MSFWLLRENWKLTLWKLFYVLHFYHHSVAEKKKKYCSCFLMQKQSWGFPADMSICNQSHTLLKVSFSVILFIHNVLLQNDVQEYDIGAILPEKSHSWLKLGQATHYSAQHFPLPVWYSCVFSSSCINLA